MPTGVFLWKPSCQQQMWKELHFFSIAKSCESNLRKNTKDMIYWISIYTSLMASKDTYNNKFLEDVCLGFGNTETFQIPSNTHVLIHGYFPSDETDIWVAPSQAKKFVPPSYFQNCTLQKRWNYLSPHVLCGVFVKAVSALQKKQQRWRQHRFIRKNEYDPIPSNWMFTCWQLKTKYL